MAAAAGVTLLASVIAATVIRARDEQDALRIANEVRSGRPGAVFTADPERGVRFALGLDNREIARALGRSDGATKVLLHRAIRQLEGLVAEQSEDREDSGAAPDARRLAATSP